MHFWNFSIYCKTFSASDYTYLIRILQGTDCNYITWKLKKNEEEWEHCILEWYEGGNCVPQKNRWFGGQF